MSFLSSPDFWVALSQIILINIVLSGDNAVVIAMASRGLPPAQQKKAILFGSVGAIVLRVVLTFFAVYLLTLPYLKLVGAALLLWIGVGLLQGDEGEESLEGHSGLFAAIKTIVVADLVMPRSFADFQAMFDAGEPRGKRNYWKSEYVSDLDDEIVAILLDHHRRMPTPSSNIKVFALGGAVARVPAATSAAAHRDARYIIVFATSWESPADDARNVAWVRDGWAAVHARSGRGAPLTNSTQ